MRTEKQGTWYARMTSTRAHSLCTMLLHMDTITVDVGEKVKQGEQIGTIGTTGRSTGPHLDWRINLGKMRLDPQTIISGSPET